MTNVDNPEASANATPDHPHDWPYQTAAGVALIMTPLITLGVIFEVHDDEVLPNSIVNICIIIAALGTALAVILRLDQLRRRRDAADQARRDADQARRDRQAAADREEWRREAAADRELVEHQLNGITDLLTVFVRELASHRGALLTLPDVHDRVVSTVRAGQAVQHEALQQVAATIVSTVSSLLRDHQRAVDRALAGFEERDLQETFATVATLANHDRHMVAAMRALGAQVRTAMRAELAAVRNRIDRLAKAPERGRGRNSRSGGGEAPAGGSDPHVTRLVPAKDSKAFDMGRRFERDLSLGRGEAQE